MEYNVELNFVCFLTNCSVKYVYVLRSYKLRFLFLIDYSLKWILLKRHELDIKYIFLHPSKIFTLSDFCIQFLKYLGSKRNLKVMFKRVIQLKMITRISMVLKRYFHYFFSIFELCCLNIMYMKYE